MTRRLLAAVLLILGVLAVPGEGLARPASPGQSSIAIPGNAPSGTLLSHERISLPPNYRAKAWRILYLTRDYRLRPLLSTGIVVLPDKAAALPPLERKFVAWAHPTTGIARKCAPSLRATPAKAIGGLNALVASGLVVAATDYPGLGTEGPVGYLVGRGQAYATLDSVRAARQIPEVGGGPDFALWGFSQGGHAALFAAQLAGEYAPELALKGVAAIAPPTDLALLMRANLDSIAGRILLAFTLSSWSVKYDAPLAPLVDDTSAALVREVGRSCVDDLGEQLNALAAQRSLKQDFLRADPAQTAPWADLLVQNSVFALGSSAPALIIQGAADDIVKPAVTTGFVRAACKSGAAVQYVSLPAKGHSGAMEQGEDMAVAWLAARLAGQPPRSNCR